MENDMWKNIGMKLFYFFINLAINIKMSESI